MANDIIKAGFNFSVFMNIFMFIISLIYGANPGGFSSKVVVGTFEFNIDISWGTFIASTLVTLALIALAGLNVIGSGLASESVKIIRKVIAYLILWTYISLFSLGLFQNLDFDAFPLGTLFFLVLTFFYCIGVLKSFAEEGGGND